MSAKSEKPTTSILDRADACTLLHQGGEANVYELSCGEDRYALKWYHAGSCFDDSVVDRLKHLNVPGLYRVRESGTRDNTAYLVYDFLDGANSAEAPAMPVVVALKLLRSLVLTLDLMDKEGIHHGDINPANVLLCQSGAALNTVLIDCGIVGPGALAYAAPERFQGKSASTKSDLYSLGMLLFHWISGQDLLASQDYNELAAQAMAIENVDVSSRLYDSERCKPQELSALEPLWKALLRESPENRAEDFDELDELLEIALDSMGVGEVTAQTAIQKYAKELFTAKVGQKFPIGEKKAFPYRKYDGENEKNNLKIVILAFFGLILIALVIVLYVGTKSPDIDETGNLLLQKSRSLESGFERDSEKTIDSVPPVMLKDLPTPAME
ncbi:Serine/threonine protein kinase [Fibrobacter sp. UWB15]|jgi:serine/threonine protein kinase|uniref:serine/threonine protein kinase n=1 Tax=unclassified Fibrobacter TaxID=2634177 RepID=UPI0009181E07|nr:MULTISPECIES: protein kinase [unclassified Fibrobacter]PWJ64616.1 serine/threonine protein kinase [Fibrobacter sp. UWB6]SHG18664.1 Serine/threonine protein kinase [Fibrobacter sp. UWB8]SMG33578.1 Serine/threonine protein kinase [Fibrobacter sp. UWB15]